MTDIDTHKPILHFAHANSFPAGTYRSLFANLALHYDVQALELHAHNPAYPVTDGWEVLAQELIATLEARYAEPVILVGHSLGGMLSLLVAKVRPDLVRCVVMLDSPIIAGWRAAIVRFFKRVGLMKRYSPARYSEKRRTHWASAEDAYQHFVGKDVFAAWPNEVMRDYLRSGLFETDNGVRLRFDRAIETSIYLAIPHHLGPLTYAFFPVPVGFIGGIDSVECRRVGLAATRRLVGENFMQLPGGHLLPLEYPAQTAAAMHAMIQSLLSDSSATLEKAVERT